METIQYERYILIHGKKEKLYGEDGFEVNAESYGQHVILPKLTGFASPTDGFTGSSHGTISHYDSVPIKPVNYLSTIKMQLSIGFGSIDETHKSDQITRKVLVTQWKLLAVGRYQLSNICNMD